MTSVMRSKSAKPRLLPCSDMGRILSPRRRRERTDLPSSAPIGEDPSYHNEDERAATQGSARKTAETNVKNDADFLQDWHFRCDNYRNRERNMMTNGGDTVIIHDPG